MKTLNLVDLENSDIKYKISTFPDGQQQVTVNFSLEIGCVSDYPVQIKARLNDFKCLELIICIIASLRELGVKEIHLYTPYIMGARSDRKFEEGSNNYLKSVICPILNSLKLESITCVDPHSHVLEACLNNFKSNTNFELVRWSLHRMDGEYENISNTKILISPDAGASHKIYKLAEQIGYKGDIITCSKERDTEGKLTKTVIPVSTIVHKDYIIIDDICDGGNTFINIAKILKPRLHSSNRIFLIVTHGIFSKEFDELNKYFDCIYCTNSYKYFGDITKLQTSKLKQLSVF